MKRREFLKMAGAAAAAGMAMQQNGQAADTPASKPSSNAPKLPRRPYGKTGIELSIIGLGGIVVMKAEPEQAKRVVAESVERGVNYFDVAPTYGDAEIKLGPALEPYRKNVFLACKTGQRRRGPADEEMKRSFERLRTDHFDLYQLHGLVDIAKDVDAAFADDGVMPLLIEAKKDGRIRHIGFSAHSVDASLAAMDRFDFDSILFPVNFACYYKGNFGRQVIEAAKAKGMARLALKAMARQVWPDNDPQRDKYGKCWYQPLHNRREAELGLRFTLSQPVTAALPPGEEAPYRMALDLAMDLKPITKNDEAELRELAKRLNPIFEHKPQREA